MRVSQCVALTGNALSFLTTPAYNSPAKRFSPVYGWLVALVALNEARRSEVKQAGTIGTTLLGLAGLQAAALPRATTAMYGDDKSASPTALAFLSLGGANQLASMVYLGVMGRAGKAGDGHAKGLLSFLVMNVGACLKFGLHDASKAGFSKIGALTWATVVGSWATLVAKRVARKGGEA